MSNSTESLIPKCLHQISNNSTLLDFNLKNLLTIEAITSIDIVVGYKYKLVDKFLTKNNYPKKIKTIINENYNKSVIYSVIKGFDNLTNSDTVLLLNGDTLYSKSILDKVVHINLKQKYPITLFGHLSNSFLDDDILVNISNNNVMGVGKVIERPNGTSSGAILFHNDGLKKYVEILKKQSIQKLNTHHGIINEMINSLYCKVGFVDLGSRKWIEIDNQRNLKNVQENLYKYK